MSVVKNERVYGKSLGFTINGKDYWADVISAGLSEKESDSGSVTFGDYAEGGSGGGEWELQIKAILSTATASLWSLLWDQKGHTIPFIIAPHGNKTATAEKPHFTGNVIIGLRPPISLEAGGDGKPREFDITYKCQGDIEKKTESSELGTGNMEDN